MNAPVNKFVREYAKSGIARFHMPGHKGQKFHGLEPWDITEIKGADYLLKPRGSSHRAKPKWQKPMAADGLFTLPRGRAFA